VEAGLPRVGAGAGARVIEAARIQGFGGGGQWKRFVAGGLETTRHSIDWDGAGTPPSSLNLGITHGSPVGSPPEASPAPNGAFLVCGRWRLLRFCLTVEAPAYVGAAIPLSVNFNARAVGGIALSQLLKGPLATQPNVTVHDVQAAAFDNQIDVSGGLLGLAIGGFDSFSGAQPFTCWLTGLWRVIA
jgi:hypothetical protein